MKRIILYPYKLGSESCKDLALETGATRVRQDGNYRPRENDLIINWGNSHVPSWRNQADEQGLSILNTPESVAIASNKLETFRALAVAGVSIPNYTTDREQAYGFRRVIARGTLNGNSGEGILILMGGQELPDAPLYTEFIPQKAEYRVHVFNGEIISYAKKQRENDNPPENDTQEMIRSHNNGWIFRKEGLRRLERIENIATEAVQALGLDFGGVDIVMDEEGEVHVLEVNSACGMEGSTLEAYRDKILDYATRE